MESGKILEITAEKCGVSVGEVRSGIAAAIDAGMESTSPEAAAFWKSVPRHGEKPTPEELLEFLTEKISPC